MKIIDLNFHANNEINSIDEAIAAHMPALGYAAYLKDRAEVIIVKHLANEEEKRVDGVRYISFKSRNKFAHIPLKTLRFVKKEKPDVVIVQGLVFPLQLIFLNFFLNKHVTVLVQNHAERPLNGIKGIIQKIACRIPRGFLFTSIGNAKEWVDKKILNAGKCYEVLEGSTYFTSKDKTVSKTHCKVEGDPVFLWVGRLEENKDPITVIKGFEKYLSIVPTARLYMIYQEDDLLTEVTDLINENALLRTAVTLIGKVNYDELPYWYSAADYYLSGSHREGSGYALLEAMACGCIPIVTDIPSFRKMTGNVEVGHLYKAGDADALYNVLLKTNEISKKEHSTVVVDHFEKELSFRKIADDVYKICKQLICK